MISLQVEQRGQKIATEMEKLNAIETEENKGFVVTGILLIIVQIIIYF